MSRRLGKALAVAKPLSPAQARAALVWLPKATVHEIVALRRERGGNLFLITTTRESKDDGKPNTQP